ncbi:serine palmitoyltransferase 1-like isoform X2 [Scylla paramamosain]|uniref:serine palmitoyltransferase 1-like isoform X2 n=1 Tax=Scylla paramamosain TaxID=85552 RepID=UPI003083C3AB
MECLRKLPSLITGPYHLALEGVLVLCILWLFTAKKQPSKTIRLSLKEEEDLLREWEPEPLVPHPPPPDHPSLHPRTVYGKPSKYINIGTGQRLLNFATQNYLGLGEREEVVNEALSCLHRYGVGSCGPRGFYGTTEVHLQLEEKLAQFFNSEAAILYAYGFSTSASAIPAYAKNGDIIFADEMVNFSLQRGLQASRSKVIYFRHNDLGHLEELLEAQERQDAKDPKRANATRKFVVVEGIYMNTGRLCDLPGLVTLRQRYRLRLFLDEAVSFATLGSHCRGITDHFSVPMKEVDLLMGTLEGAGGCAGGFCVGTKFVVEHQRLSGLGYCFSASLPPMLAAASIKAVELLEREGPELVEALQRACTHTHTALTATLPDSVEVGGDEISPIKHLRLTRPCSDDEAEVILRQVVQQAQEEGVALTVAAYLRAQEREAPRPSIRVSVSAALSQEEIENAVGAISRAFQKVLG